MALTIVFSDQFYESLGQILSFLHFLLSDQSNKKIVQKAIANTIGKESLDGAPPTADTLTGDVI